MNDICATMLSGSTVHTAQGHQFTLEPIKATFHCVYIHINPKASRKLGPVLSGLIQIALQFLNDYSLRVRKCLENPTSQSKTAKL